MRKRQHRRTQKPKSVGRRRVEEHKGSIAIRFALTVIVTSLVWRCSRCRRQPRSFRTLFRAPVRRPFSVRLTVWPDSVMQTAGLQKEISGSQNLGLLHHTWILPLAGACIPSTETGAAVGAGNFRHGRHTLDGLLRTVSCNYYGRSATGHAGNSRATAATGFC